MKLPIGVAVKLKRLGYARGTPDILIFQPNARYHGLFIEMKRLKDGRVKPDQEKFKDRLNQLGYLSVICKGFDEAKTVIDEYLK